MIKQLLLAVLCGLILNINIHAAECLQPNKLIFSVTPTKKKTLEIKAYEPLVNAIFEQSGLLVELRQLHSYDEIVNEFIKGNLHFARMGAFSYVTATHLSPFITPFAVHYHASKPPFQKQGTFYHSVLIVHTDSNYHNIESLRGKPILLTSKGSTSGSLVPRVLFTKQVKAAHFNDFFSAVIFSGGHDNSALAVANKDFDAAFVSSRNLGMLFTNNVLKENPFKIIWKSKPLPFGPYVYNNRLCKEYVDIIRQASLNIHQSEQGQEMLRTLGALKLVPAQAADYDIIHELSVRQK